MLIIRAPGLNREMRKGGVGTKGPRKIVVSEEFASYNF